MALTPAEQALPGGRRRQVARKHALRRPAAGLSHSWALRAHGLDRVPPTALPEVTVRLGHVPRYEEMRVHRTRSLDRIDIEWIRGMPCTSGARIVIDLAGQLSEAQTMALTDDAICARRTSRPHLHRRAGVLGNGRAGVDVISRITAPGAEGVFWSWFERSFDTLVRAHDLPVPAYNVPLRDREGLVGYADALWAAARVVVELMGLQFHSRPADRQRDGAKGNRYALLGLLPLAFTYVDIVERPSLVVDQLRRALRCDG